MNIISAIFILGGLFFFTTGTIGLLRFPDFYTRMHATGKCDTLGALLILIGVAIHMGISLISIKVLFIAFFIFLANPTATHAVIRAGYKSGVPVWTKDKKGTRQ